MGNKQVRRIGIIFGMVGVLEPQHMPAVLKNHMSEPATRPEAGYMVLTRVADGPQCLVEMFIGTARRDPQAREAVKKRVVNRCRREPHAGDIGTEACLGMGKGGARGDVGWQR